MELPLLKWERLGEGFVGVAVAYQDLRCEMSSGRPKFGAEVQVGDAQTEVISDGSCHIALKALGLNAITFSTCLHSR